MCPLQWPTGIAAYQQVQGGPVYIFVVDRRNQSVEKFELNQNMNELTYCGTTQADVDVDGVQNGVGGVFKSPVGIAVHPVTGRVYVADTGKHRIQILDENLNFIGELVTISSRDHMTYPLLMMTIMLLCMLLIMATTESRSMTLYTLGQVRDMRQCLVTIIFTNCNCHPYIPFHFMK